MILEYLARYIANEQRVTLEPEVLMAAKRCVIDWFASVLPGGLVPPATLMAGIRSNEGATGRSMVFPHGRRTEARVGALINGSAAHTLEVDDIYRNALYHPGAPIIAAVLATAQEKGVDGPAFLRAIVIGYEVSTRLGEAVNPAHYKFWHTTGTIGTFGAAAAVAGLLRLDEKQALHALATAGTFAAGLQQAFRGDSMSKPLHAGRAAETGVLVAHLAEQGVTGAPDILEGERGFGVAMAEHPDWWATLEDLGKKYNITETTFKNHASCGHTHAAIEGLLELRAKHHLDPEKVRRISVGTYQTALEVAGIPQPRTPFEGKFSIAYCVTVALLTGRVRLNAFSEDRVNDTTVHRLMDKVETYAETEAEAVFPDQRQAVVEIEVEGGDVYRCVATRKGDPKNPLTDEELVDKFRELVGPVIEARKADAFLDTLWSLEEVDDLNAPFFRLNGQTRSQDGGGALAG